MSQSHAKPKNRARESGGNLEKLVVLQQKQLLELLTGILVEMRVQSFLMKEGLHRREKLEDLRRDHAIR